MHQVQIRREPFSAANVVTCCRFALAVALAGIVLLDGPRALIGFLAATALISDFVDGRLARARGTASRLGARLDQEADAVLILVLSAIVASDLGPWVLGLGLARYAFGTVFTLIPALRTQQVRARYWCKVVAATTGVVLAAVAAVPLPALVASVAVAVVAVLLAESFLHEAVDRWRAPRPGIELPAVTVLAGVAVWLAMALPSARVHLGAEVLLRLPFEVVLLIALALLPWRRVRVALALLAGLVLAVLVMVTALDLGFREAFHRGFDPVGDWSFLGPGVGVLGDSIGQMQARVVAVVLALAVAAVMVVLPLAVVRLVGLVAAHRRRAVAAGTAVGLVWGVLALTGVEVASAGAVRLSVSEVKLVRSGFADRSAFATQIATDPYGAAAQTAPATLLSGLAGKDVLLVFVESYGRVAVQGTTYSDGIDRVLDQGTADLDAAGYHQRSAFLTSPTFGGWSWLAHSSLESGLWVNSQRRYDQLLGAKRLTLIRLFGNAGWRTVFDVPADTEDWPQGRDYYGFGQYYDSRNVGYAGPKFGYSPVPDQYTLEQFRRNELTPGHRPVMAEIDLTSSHHPWTPLPTIVPWNQIGDGSIFRTMPQTPTPAQVLGSAIAARRMYGKSVEYTWQSLVSFLTTYRDPNLVLVVLGDHQPHAFVSGPRPGHDVPISVIAQDPSVIGRIDGWNWQPGLHPGPDAPVWPMDAFRDQFLNAFGR